MANRLIDADKQSDWLEKAAFVWFGRYGEYGEGYCKALSDIKTAMESGEFAPDPIPLPTIKPEDWVYHTKFKAKGQVKRISESGKRAYVIWINGAAPSFVDLKSLEVVSHD